MCENRENNVDKTRVRAVLKETSARESIFRSSAQTMSLTELRFWDVLNQNLKGRGRNQGFGQPNLS